MTKMSFCRRCPHEEPDSGNLAGRGEVGWAESCIFMMNINFNSRVIVHCESSAEVGTGSGDIHYPGFSLHMEMLTLVSFKASP